MDKIVHGLEPNKSYKIRYRAVYNDDRKSAPTIAYTVTTPSTPTPPEVDQDTITVDSQSFKDGIIISWTAPDPDDTRPSVSDYFVQITDDLNDWDKFDLVTTETKTIFSEQDQLVSFGTLVPVIYIRVITRSINKLFSTPDSYKEYEFASETGLRPPDIVTALGLNYSWRVSWSYVPSRPDIVTGYRIYDSETVVANINNAITNSYTSPQDLNIGGQIKTIGVSAIDAEGNESAIRYANPFVVGEIILDLDAPPQRENINFTSVSGTSNILCTWTNTNLAGDPDLNDDLSGIVIRYALTSDPTNYYWINVPFKFSDNLTQATITNLIPNTSYNFQLSTFDSLFNATSYSAVVTVSTGRDTSPPPKPCPPSISAGAEAGGPMMIRVQQRSREPLVSDPNDSNGDPTKPLPFDTSFFQIWMLNAGQTTSPTGSTNPNATQIGTVVAGFNGIETQAIIYNSTLTEGQTRYFYTRAVDTSGNIGEASVAKVSTSMTVFSDAYIGNLSASKIFTSSLNTSTIITVGSGPGAIQINGSGKLYSGAGVYNNQNTGFYLDSSANFSLKDRLTFNSETSTLSITGNITAQSGIFSGNVGVIGGALFAGGVSTGTSGGVLQRVQNNQIVIAEDGMAAKIPDPLNTGQSITTFALLTDGTALFSGDVTAKTFSGTSVKIFGANSGDANINIPNFAPVYYSLLSSDGKDLLLKSPIASDPAKIRWLDDANYQRGTIGWETSNSENYPFTFVLRAIGFGTNPGKLLLSAVDNGLYPGELTLRANVLNATGITSNLLSSSAQIVGISANGRLGIATGSNLSVQAGYINATDNNNQANKITYSTQSASDYYGSRPALTPREGDVHLRYI